MNRKAIFRKANKEFQRLCGFDLLSEQEYIDGTMTLHGLIARNQQWLLDHVNDVERGMRAHLKNELNAEP